MTSPTLSIERFMDDQDLLRELRTDVGRGLAAEPRWLSPRWFYDERGSLLFDEITRLPEYYLYSAERSILETASAAVSDIVGPVALVELGSGYSKKTLLLLDALAHNSHLRGIVTLDVSESALRDAGDKLTRHYPNVPLHAIVGDYSRHLSHIPPAPDGASRMLVFLGSTIGNLIPDERTSFLAACADALQPGDHFLLGADLVKDPAILTAAYNDAAGITARFNRNILDVIRTRLRATVESDAFEHHAWWDENERWVQVALRASRPTDIVVPDVVTAHFDTGDEIYTEVSAKFTPAGLDDELGAAGFDTHTRWFDEYERFSLTLARRR